MVILPSLHITGIHLYGNLPERKLEQELKSKWRLYKSLHIGICAIHFDLKV